uniref:Neuropeptide (NdWFamide) n=1 Tax=Aplysia kurodai TaxID=6501 RepID=K7ZR41_APLKU|nr:neuropeptide (NdWFamide) precursor [Aplysia kurodai]
MSRTLAAITLVFLLSVVCSPASANWFGKRGDKDGLFSLLLQQQPAHTDDSVVPLASSGAEDAMFAIENIVKAWRQHRSEKLSRSTQG